jgi:hypothetical protein
MTNAYRTVTGKTEEKRHMGDTTAYKTITLRWILQKHCVKA